MKTLNKINYLKLGLFIILLISGLYINYTWETLKNNKSEEILQIARSIVATFPKNTINALNANQNDIEKSEYQSLKSTLNSIIKANPKARFAYLYTQKNNQKLYFLVDSEPENSKDCSPPGQEYTEADNAYQLPFINNKEYIIGPASDRWGRWMSVLVPIKSETTGKIIAVFAMDFNSNSWDNILIYKLTESIILILLLLSTFIFLLIIKTKNEKLKADIKIKEITKEKLKESENLLQTIFDTEPECIKMIDENGCILQMNPAGLKILEADSFEQISGHQAINIVAPEYKNSFLQMNKRVLNGESVQMEFELISLKGTHKWVETNAVPMKNKGKTVILAHTHNITQKKQTLHLLEENKLFLNETQKIAHLGTYTFDLKNDSWKSSPILDTIFGIETNYPKNTNGWLTIIHPDHKEYIFDYFKEVIQNKERFNKEYKIIRQSDKKERWLHGLGETHYDEFDQPIQMIGTIQDITESKHIQEELIIAKEKAEESDRLKSAFLANMSHEIRTPMNGILGFAELLKEPNLSGKEQQEFIKIIEQSGTRMLNIINDIIDISKIESGLMTVNTSDTNINEQIEYIYKFFKLEADQKGIQIFFKNGLPSNKSLIKTDTEKIYAVLINLVKNAIKFTSSGSIEFGYNLKPITNESSGKSELEFYVKDTGLGINNEQKDIVFERFRQTNESISRNFEGAGLGLSISKAFVKMLGGNIWVESEKGKGSTFYFTIPYNWKAKNIDSIENLSPITNLKSIHKKLKILIAEDDEISARLLTKTIDPFAKEIIRAKTGTETLEICRNNSDIDMILMDIQMPELNGYETTREIRKFNKKVVIIAQTANVLTDDKLKTIEFGCNDYIAKPIKKEELSTLIQTYFKY